MMNIYRSLRVAALLIGMALGAASCASALETNTGVAESGVVDDTASTTTGGNTTDDAAGESTDDGSDDTASDQADDDGYEDSSGGDSSPAATGDSGGLDAKQTAARSIDDFSEADEPAGLGNADVAEVAFDVPNDGEIEEVFGVDRWTFDAEAGQLLGIDVLDIDNDCRLDLHLVLEGPTGDRGDITWVGNGGCNGLGPLLLEDAGTYVIEFSGGDGSVIDDNTGTYRFVPYILTERDVAAPSFDVPNDGEISELFGVDRWTFEGNEGDLLTIDMLDIDNDCRLDLSMTIQDPFGEREDLGWIGNGGCDGHGPYELEQTGTYVLEFWGGNGAVITDYTGTYRFVPRFLTELDEQAASFGPELNGEISQLFGRDRWTFEANEGDLLTVDMLSIDHDCRQDLTMSLEDPFGEREDLGWIGNGGCEGHGPYELDRAGTYILEFSGGNGGVIKDETGAYTFKLALS